MASFLSELSQPEYVHTLINPLPVYGLAVAIVSLIIALLLRSRRAQIAGLTLILLCAASAWPVAHYGSEGYDRVLSMSDDQGSAWLKVHMHRADQLIWFSYGLVALALITIAVQLWKKRAGVLLAVIVVLYSLVVLAMGGYISYAGGRVRHREFRSQPAPSVPPETDEQ